MSLDVLLQAAEFLERRDREAEHGYATLLPDAEDEFPSPKPVRQSKVSKKMQGGSRSSHNELEKNRRAHLRNCLEGLKDLVPLGTDSSRHTTLGLLNKAKHFIRNLEDRDRKSVAQKENLFREQRYLRRRLELLSSQVDAIHKRRSISESSTSTVSSIQSSTSESDDHEVDVLGYGGVSDDDISSVRSTGSDGGMSVNTWNQLTIVDTNV
ncbi:max-interacting protein 1 [Eurytemora carolleeae]|uniref:max-interacting protein 1 n=1 Tax=Eurytemora carolleeae TaxID=1294199 RepID=UPI000C75B350|nr:max-interacting protein 1 [Eurytemora carolleeae]|eukprot:XP_023330902.1 max-interacting protein 1-like [Eurytemora affinis]